MQPFSNKQLYMMNGGNKLYIHKDGFGDVYSATPAEEAEWAEEVIANALEQIESSENRTVLDNALDNLQFHKYEGLETLLLSKIENVSDIKRAAFENILRKIEPDNIGAEAESVKRIYQDLIRNGNENMYRIFDEYDQLKNQAAKLFVVACVEGSDDELFIRATTTLGKWAYSGMPDLRQNRLLQTLQPEHRDWPTFPSAVAQLKTIFQIPDNS